MNERIALCLKKHIGEALSLYAIESDIPMKSIKMETFYTTSEFLAY